MPLLIVIRLSGSLFFDIFFFHNMFFSWIILFLNTLFLSLYSVLCSVTWVGLFYTFLVFRHSIGLAIILLPLGRGLNYNLLNTFSGIA